MAPLKLQHVETIGRICKIGRCLPYLFITTSELGSCVAGVTSENVAAKYGVSRETQDKFAAQSHARMAAAQQAGKFDREIVPVATKLKVACRLCTCLCLVAFKRAVHQCLTAGFACFCLVR